MDFRSHLGSNYTCAALKPTLDRMPCRDNRAKARTQHSTVTEHAGAKRRKSETRRTATEHAETEKATASHTCPTKQSDPSGLDNKEYDLRSYKAARQAPTPFAFMPEHGKLWLCGAHCITEAFLSELHCPRIITCFNAIVKEHKILCETFQLYPPYLLNISFEDKRTKNNSRSDRFWCALGITYEALNSGCDVVVHCAGGRHRAAFTTALMLVFLLDYDWQTAMTAVSEKRRVEIDEYIDPSPREGGGYTQDLRPWLNRMTSDEVRTNKSMYSLQRARPGSDADELRLQRKNGIQMVQPKPKWLAARSSASSSAQRTRYEDNHDTATEPQEHAAETAMTILRHQEEAQADRAQEDMGHLMSKLSEFLIYVMRKLYGSSHGQLKCEDIVVDTIGEWARMWTNLCASELLYCEDDLKLHKKMWDIMTREKDGRPKKHDYDMWCRRIANAAKSADNDASAYLNLARDVFAKELTPKQKKDPDYKLHEGKGITTKQCSLINVLLRKNLGDARVVYYILRHGVPAFLDPHRLSKPPTKALLQSMLEEFMMWHASLLRWLLERQQHPYTSTAQKLSALDQQELVHQMCD